MRRLAIWLALALSASASASTSTALAAGAARPAAPRNVAIVVYEGAEILDFAGPAEVLQAAGWFGGDGATRALRLYTVARSRDPIVVQDFIRIVPEFSIADAPRPNVIVIPGGNSEALSKDEAMMKWLRSATGRAEVTLTVCTGAFPLAELGALDGKEITTWYGAIEGLQKRAPRAQVVSGRRFIDNGKYITTAGVSAGIDGSLHLVARMLGRRVADQTARYMEYHWTPESYLAAGYQYWNPSTDRRGRALQRARQAADEKRWGEAAAELRALVAERPRDDTAWLTLGWVQREKGDNRAAIAAFHRVAAASPRRAEALFETARAHLALGDRKTAARVLSQALAAGFSREHAMHDAKIAALLAETSPTSAR
jgi:putative intracellular protease/amidase